MENNKNNDISNPIIKLSICGVRFELSKNILTKSEYFKELFDDNKIPEDEIIFLQRSPVIFPHIISLLIDPEYKFPQKYNSELKYFLMEKSEPISVDIKPIISIKLQDTDNKFFEIRNKKDFENFTFFWSRS